MLLLLYHGLYMLHLTFGFELFLIQDRQGKIHNNLRYIREKIYYFHQIGQRKTTSHNNI